MSVSRKHAAVKQMMFIIEIHKNICQGILHYGSSLLLTFMWAGW